MKRPRISIAKLMGLVAIAGANFAYLRWFGTEGTLLGTRLIVLFLWVGLPCGLSVCCSHYILIAGTSIRDGNLGPAV